MYPDNIDLLKKLQELFSARNKKLNSQTQAEDAELCQLITEMLKKIIDRNDNKLTDEEELQFQKLSEKLSENESYVEENFAIKNIILLHRSKNKQDPLSHIELAKNFSDNGFYQKAVEYYQWVLANCKNGKFLKFAWYSLGVLYEKKMDFAQAKTYYIKFIQAHDPTQPCSSEVPYAIYRYARMTALGLGIKKDLVEAKKLFGNLVKLYSYKDAMFDLAEILYEEKDFFQAKQFYDIFITSSKLIVNNQEFSLKKMDALYKLELIEKTEKDAAAENLKQKKLQKKLNKTQSKPFAKSPAAPAAVDMEAMLLMANELLKNKKYKESKKQFLAIKALIDNASNKFDFLTLNEKNIVCYVKCIWGMANCLFALNKLAGANNLYKESLQCIETYSANHKEFDALVGIRYAIEADAKAIADKLNRESPDVEIDEQTPQKSQKRKSKKKKKPAKLASVFGSEVKREILDAVIPDAAMCILNILKKAGIVPYIYGGFIRDRLLKINHADIDIASKTSHEKVKKILEEYFSKNVNNVDPKHVPKKIQLKKNFHGVIIHYADGEHIDITTFRDYDNKDHYDPNKLGNFVTHSRTYDLTINGLLLDPFTKEIIDLVGGISDAREKKLRVNDPERFFDLDPARMLRVIRFAARFCPDFTIVDKDKVFKCMDDYCYKLNDSRKISRGKLFEEISALFSGGIGLASYKLLKTTKLLPFLFPHFPVLKSQGYLETKFFSFDAFIEKVLEKAKTASKPECYGLPLLFAVILWPLLLDQLIKCNNQFEVAAENVRKLQAFDIYADVWFDIRLIWVIHYYKTEPLTMNNLATHYMAETFSQLAAEANQDWKDVKKMFAEKKEKAFRYSEISQLPQVFSLFSLENSKTEEVDKTVENTL